MSNLTRYDPLDDLFRGFFVRPVDFGQMPEAPSVKIDVKEQEKAYTVHAELPGIKKEDIHVTIEGGMVMLRAEVRQEDAQSRDDRLLRSERYYGAVSRGISLPQDVDPSQAKARYDNGVLTLTLPRKQGGHAHKLRID